MKTRVGEITRTTDATEKDVFHSFATGMCPECENLVDAARIIRGGKVYLAKSCPEHGKSEALISGDADWFLKSLTYIKKGQIPHEYSTEAKEGCPNDCGLCPEHEQHSCLPMIEVTNHCNMDCPICIVDNRHNYHIPEADFAGIIDNLIRKEGELETINVSGGEPTLHPDLLELLDIANRPEISRISISTNGIRIAEDMELCREIAKRDVYVSLQIDATASHETNTLRGSGKHFTDKAAALDNLKEAGVRTSLVATIAKGVNEAGIGECVQLLLENDFILSLMFQPVAYTGAGGSSFEPHDPMNIITIPDIVREIEKQTGGQLKTADFLPLPCSSPSCFALTYLLIGDDSFTPFTRFIELDRYLDAVANIGTIRADEEFEDTLRDTINDMWTSAAEIPDSEKILSILKEIITKMYPEDGGLEHSERMHIGEGYVKTIFIHAFMDKYTFELDRIMKCCRHYALPDGRLMPGCSYNMFHRKNDARLGIGK